MQGIKLLSVIVLDLTIDQISKVAATRFLWRHPPHAFFGGALRLQYALNDGAFLSIGANLSPFLRFCLFTVGTAVLVGCLCAYALARRQMEIVQIIGIGTIIAGGLGNLIDRCAGGGLVRDFLYVALGPIHTGIFNVADLLITSGALLLVVQRRRRIQ